MPHPLLIFSQSDNLTQIVDTNSHSKCKQCRSRSVGFFRSQLIWLYTVCKGREHPDSAGPGLIFFLWFFTGKAFDHDFPGHQVIENEYEPIANIFPSRATATATVIESYASAASASQKKPDLPPKPPGLQMMVEPGQTPKRVQAQHNFRGTNNDEVRCIVLHMQPVQPYVFSPHPQTQYFWTLEAWKQY